MLRILAFFIIVLAAGLGFAWLADNPGSVSVVWQGQELRTSFMVLVIALLGLLVAVVLAFWLFQWLFGAPDRVGRFFANRRRDRGYRALSAGILAAGAGDATVARRMETQSRKLISADKEPLLRFLDAQTAMIEGDHARARRVFEVMEKDPDTRLLALRGLYLEAERLNDAAAARHYAEQAVRVAPHLQWAGGAVLELKAAEGDYDSALAILEAQRNSRLVDKAESRRLRAVLLTGKALDLADADPVGARNAAREAQKLAPDLIPAALVAARSLVRLNEGRKAHKILESTWQAAPHPDIAELYVHLNPGDNSEERLKRAQRLADLQPQHPESLLAVAHAAFEARNYSLAREQAEQLARTAPRENVFLLLADIEEAESGDEGRVRSYMQQALRAPRDPAWTTEGIVSPEWKPISPISGRLDAFAWKAPVQAVASEPKILEEETLPSVLENAEQKEAVGLGGKNA
ncbi:heme biosynthesis protein HemY [Aureimonas fodinaquatilis]|uniref:Heme biosynthesis protein HemY n=1 Tax=Aureimonas fodinaquatilis TaxID=2565783 RepID=A0A5B0DUK3_9HYPH|nr:heme biosynthesis HemY N-terminal domain-containing protein [Aureimonas fodinaquatilis]KAA0969682.1 heme biosynthesis protein HemY [Aureimonas fodinaquatilis]